MSRTATRHQRPRTAPATLSYTQPLPPACTPPATHGRHRRTSHATSRHRRRSRRPAHRRRSTGLVRRGLIRTALLPAVLATGLLLFCTAAGPRTLTEQSDTGGTRPVRPGS